MTASKESELAWSLAVHEAGHAVMAVSLGRNLIDVVIYPEHERGHTRLCPADASGKLWNDACIAYAGEASEKAIGVERLCSAGRKDDEREIASALDELQESCPDDDGAKHEARRGLLRKVDRFFARRDVQSALLAVAKILHTRKKISGPEAHAIIAAHLDCGERQ